LTDIGIANTQPKNQSDEEDNQRVLNQRLAAAIENQSFRSEAKIIHATRFRLNPTLRSSNIQTVRIGSQAR
jgi:hypothetical protein